VALARRPEAIVATVVRTAWSATRQPVDLEQYCEQLERRVGKAHEVMHLMIHKRKDCKRLVFTEKQGAVSPNAATGTTGLCPMMITRSAS
jgi:hypothetical protein